MIGGRINGIEIKGVRGGWIYNVGHETGGEKDCNSRRNTDWDKQLCLFYRDFHYLYVIDDDAETYLNNFVYRLRI